MSYAVAFVRDFTQSLITLFVLLNPIGAIPFFQGLTAEATQEQKAAIAKRATIIAIAVLMVFAYLGDIILGALQITTYYVMIAGGVFILVFAVKDVVSSESQAHAESLTKKSKKVTGRVDEGVAVFPLAIPLLAGPGAIATVMVLNNPQYGALTGWTDFTTLLAIVVDCLIVWFLFSLSNRLMRFLKPSFMVITGKVMDILMGAIGIAFLVHGAVAIFGISLP
ncbi:MAG TPA: MarC family protein [Terriglobales bacterium]|nr:MarC family protein [Terriglobales bacterium]